MTEAIRAGDTAGDLLGRLADGGAELLVRTLDGIEDGSLEARAAAGRGGQPGSQDHRRGRARRLGRSPAVAVDRRVRACTPAPGAWTTYEGERLKLGPVRRRDRPGAAGARACWRWPRTPCYVGTGTHPVRLGEVQAAGQASRWRPPTGPAASAVESGASVRVSDPRARKPRRPRVRVRPTRPAQAAYDVLRAVREQDAYANLVLPPLLRERGLTGRDAAFATELVYGTLRRQGTYDAVIAACLDRPLAEVDPAGAGRAAARCPPAARACGCRRTRRSATTVDLVRGRGRPRAGRLRQRRAAQGGRARPGRLGRPSRARPGRTRSATWRPRTPTRAGSSTGVRRRARRRPRARLDAAAGGRQRAAPGHPGRPARPGRPSTSWSAGRWRAPGAGRRTRSGWTAGDPGELAAVARRPGRRAGRGQPAGRAGAGRRAPSRAATSAGSTCAPGPAARPALLGALAARRGAAAARRRAAPHRAALVARRRRGRRRAARRRSTPTAAPGLARRRRSTGCWSTSRAPGSARCAGGPRRAGAVSPADLAAARPAAAARCWRGARRGPSRRAWSPT